MHKSSVLSMPCWVGRLLLWSLAELTAIKQQNIPSQEIMLTKQFCWMSTSCQRHQCQYHLFSRLFTHGMLGSLEFVSALATLLAPHGAVRAEIAAATPSPSTRQKLSPPKGGKLRQHVINGGSWRWIRGPKSKIVMIIFSLLQGLGMPLNIYPKRERSHIPPGEKENHLQKWFW